MADLREPNDADSVADTQPVWRGTARAPRRADTNADPQSSLDEPETDDTWESTSPTQALLPRTTPAPEIVSYPEYVYVLPASYRPVRRHNLFATLSLVLGLAGTVICGLSVAGVIMGHVARRQLRHRDEEGDDMALAGIIVSWVVTVLYLVVGCGGALLFLSLVQRLRAG